MKGIARFYTLFWIIYFPVCIAFTKQVGFDYADELMVLGLVAWAMTQQRKMVREPRRRKEIMYCALILAAYFVYSIVIHVTTTKGIVLDIMQQIRPYAMFYTTWMLAPMFKKQQKRWMLAVAMMSSAYYVYDYIARSGGFAGAMMREDGDLSIVALLCGVMYYTFTKPTKRNAYIALFIMLVGLLCGKSKYFGQCVCFVAVVFFMKEKVKFNSAKVYLQVGALVAAVLFSSWAKFNAYYVEGMEGDDVEEMAARPATYKTAGKILWDYFPLGSGYGSFGTAAAAKEYSPLYYKYGLDEIWGLDPENPMFLADCFYPTLAQFGFVGIVFFLAFWWRRIREIQRIENMQYYRMALMVVLIFAIDSTSNTGYLSSFGMGFFMILAMCLNSNRYLSKKRVEISKDSTSQGSVGITTREEQ